MKASSSYHPAWHSYRRHRNALFAAVMSLIGLAVLIALVPEDSILRHYSSIPALLILLWFLVANLQIALWRCPRCD